MDKLDAYGQAYRNGYEKGFSDARQWNKADKLPTKEKQYLVKTIGYASQTPYHNLLYFTNDLCLIDGFSFADKKGIPGFYYYDSEYGYVEFGKDHIIGWMEIPE